MHPRNGGAWTEARYNSFVKGALRSARWPPKYEALLRAFTERKVNIATGRVAKHYLCASCSIDFPLKQVQVDHIHPVIDPYTGFVSWDVLIERLFCEVDGFQVLCDSCHSEKTNKERAIAQQRKQQSNV